MVMGLLPILPLALLFISAHPSSLLVDASQVGAILVSGSRYWHNYRHTSNTLVLYHALRRLGLPDSSISLFLSGDPHACDPRNVHHGSMYNDDSRDLDLYPGCGSASSPLEVDFQGVASTPEALLRVLTGRVEGGVPGGEGGVSSLGPNTNLLLFMTGHGGDGFLKFHDKDELGYADLAVALREAHGLGRYGRLLVVADTCQAESLGEALAAAGVPNATLVSSSKVGQNSYAVGSDPSLGGVSLADSFSRALGAMLSREAKLGGWRAGSVWRDRGAITAAAAAAAKVQGGAPSSPSLAALCGGGGGGGKGDSPLPPACQFLHSWRSPMRQRAWLGWGNALDGQYAGASGGAMNFTVGDLVREAQALVVGDSTITSMDTGGGSGVASKVFDFLV